MSWPGQYFTSSVGKKSIMAVTGIFLVIFILVHLLGNFSMLMGADTFNSYAKKLMSLGLLVYIAEAGLIILLITHAINGISLWIKNKIARPQSYYQKSSSGKGETFASRFMPYTGILIFIFLVSHLLHFKYGNYYETYLYGGEEKARDLYRLVLEYFSSPLNVLWYLIAMSCLGLHMGHGFWSAFQTMGISNDKYNPLIKILSISLAILTAGGFGLIIIWAYFQKGGVA